MTSEPSGVALMLVDNQNHLGGNLKNRDEQQPRLTESEVLGVGLRNLPLNYSPGGS